MTPYEFRSALSVLRWSQRGLAEAIECDARLVRRWAAGEGEVPCEVAQWLSRLAKFASLNPPPSGWKSDRGPKKT